MFKSLIAQPQSVDKDMVVAQMNSCVNTLTNIINNKSMTVLEHETDQLLNNLTMQQIVGIPEIADFRTDLIEKIGKLQITEEERNIIKRINSIRQDNLKWQAFSNALNNTMMITGGGNISVQAGFQALVTIARTAVEYKVAQNELQMDELQAMWELRKQDLDNIIELRADALRIIFQLYQKYNLKESDRLTEQTSQQFQNIISTSDAAKMVRLLNDNFDKYGHIADYYYYLGMGYIDMNNIPKAMDAFSQFEQKYNRAPIYRINEKSGLISLTKIAYLKNLTTSEIETELSNALNNLPNNSMAIIQCAITYDNVLGNPRRAISILRSALDNENTSDKAAIILAGSMILPKIPRQSTEYKEFTAAYANQNTIDLNAAINICIANKYDIFKFLGKNLLIQDPTYYPCPWIFVDPVFNEEMTFVLPLKYNIDVSNLSMTIEERKGDDIIVRKYDLADKNHIVLEKIQKVKAFKHNPNLKYLYMYSIGKDEKQFKIKDQLDYNAILKKEFPHQAEFELSDNDCKDIVKFLKNNENKSTRNEFIAKEINTEVMSIKEIAQDILIYYYSGYNYHLYKQFKDQADAKYLKLFFNDSRKTTICYKLDIENNKLTPCYTQYQNKIFFVNRKFAEEFGYHQNGIKPTVESKKQPAKSQTGQQAKQDAKTEKSWWDKLWSSDDDKSNESESKKAEKEQSKEAKQDTNKEKSWWDKLWSSDDDKSNESEPKKAEKKQSKEAKQDTKTEKSWWDKLWSSDDDKSKKSE